MDTYTMRHSDRYRAIASELRLIAPKMKLAKAAEELRLMAITYERLAEHHEAVSYPADED